MERSHDTFSLRRSVESVTDMGGTPEPKPCVGADEDVDFLRGQLEASADQFGDRFNRVNREPQTQTLVREQVMDDVTDDLM
jgi:hypothetical protein